MVTVHFEQNEVSIQRAAALLQPQDGCIWILWQTLWRVHHGLIPIFCSAHQWIQHSKRVLLGPGFQLLALISTSLLFSEFKNLLGFDVATSLCSLLATSCSNAAWNSLRPPLPEIALTMDRCSRLPLYFPPVIPSSKQLQRRSSWHHKERETR